MRKLRSHFAQEGIVAKFFVAPTASRPGPMLLSVAITAVEEVIKESLRDWPLPSSITVRARVPRAKVIMPIARKARVPVRTRGSMTLPSSFMG